MTVSRSDLAWFKTNERERNAWRTGGKSMDNKPAVREGASTQGYSNKADAEINAIRNGMPLEQVTTKKARDWADQVRKLKEALD